MWVLHLHVCLCTMWVPGVLCSPLTLVLVKVDSQRSKTLSRLGFIFSSHNNGSMLILSCAPALIQDMVGIFAFWALWRPKARLQLVWLRSRNGEAVCSPHWQIGLVTSTAWWSIYGPFSLAICYFPWWLYTCSWASKTLLIDSSDFKQYKFRFFK